MLRYPSLSSRRQRQEIEFVGEIAPRNARRQLADPRRDLFPGTRSPTPVPSGMATGDSVPCEHGHNSAEAAAGRGGSGDTQLCEIEAGETASGAGEEGKEEGAASDSGPDDHPVEKAASIEAGNMKVPDYNSNIDVAVGRPADGDDSVSLAAARINRSNGGDDDDGYHTPTSPRHRIPAILECPPAPKKPPPKPMRPPGHRRQRTALDLEIKLLVARWWAEKLLQQRQLDDKAGTPKRPRIRDV